MQPIVESGLVRDPTHVTRMSKNMFGAFGGYTAYTHVEITRAKLSEVIFVIFNFGNAYSA